MFDHRALHEDLARHRRADFTARCCTAGVSLAAVAGVAYVLWAEFLPLVEAALARALMLPG